MQLIISQLVSLQQFSFISFSHAILLDDIVITFFLNSDLKGEGHSKKRICFATTNTKFILS